MIKILIKKWHGLSKTPFFMRISATLVHAFESRREHFMKTRHNSLFSKTMTKKAIRIAFTFVCTFTGILLIILFVIKYETSWKITTVGREDSPDGNYSLVFQSVGEPDWPFGASHAKVTLRDGDRIIKSFREDIADDGGQFCSDNYSVEWMKYGVVVTFKGSEQPEKEVQVFYDGRESFARYTSEEIEEILKDRYGIKKVEKITKEKDGYAIKADGIDFRTDACMALHDNYFQEVFKSTTEGLFPERFMRGLEWDIKEGETLSDLVYTPIITMNGPVEHDINSYCEMICEWLDCCFEQLPYTEAKTMYDAAGFIASAPDHEKVRLDFNNMLRLDLYSEDRVGFYNNLYTWMDRYLNYEYSAFGGSVPADIPYNETVEQIEDTGWITDEAIKQWSAYEYEVAYDFPDGREYALVPIDRALGSSIYVLLAFCEKGNPDSAELINPDPYNGAGGEARFITFLNDGITGFAALSYSGGSEGVLFETFDGGANFREIILPSPKIELPTGEYYNPFVMPEEVWEESGTIYLKVSQGPDGDYHSEAFDGARTAGIYASTDGGKTFAFVREEPEDYNWLIPQADHEVFTPEEKKQIEEDTLLAATRVWELLESAPVDGSLSSYSSGILGFTKE